MLSPLRLKNRLFYGWLVVVAFVFVGTTLWGIRSSFGVFFKSIEGEFNLTRAATSSIVSLYMVLGAVFAFLGGWALDRYGPRKVIFLMGLFTGFSLLITSQTRSAWQLYITYSLLLTMGTNAIYAVTMSTVSRWFDKKRGLALGIASVGAGLGTVVMAPFATYLISEFDWRMAYIVMGLVAWVIVIPISRLLRKDPHEIGALPDGEKSYSKEAMGLPKPKNEEAGIQLTDLSLLQLIRIRSFWFLWFIYLLYASNLFLVMTHVVPHGRDIGFSPMQAATVLSLIGGTTVVGRVLFGIASDRIGRKVTTIFCALLQGGSVVWLLWAQDLWMLYLFALVYGLAYGGMGPVLAALVSDTFGVGSIGAILGMLEIGFGVGAAIGPAIGGGIFDVTKSYFLAFLLGAVAMLIATVLISLIRRETNRNFVGEQSR